jgi:imidazole glycerol-phosphate synthase subunit HisF
MLTRRVIVCLDVKGGRVVKGVNFVGLRDVGDPVALATRYETEGADEITFLDISASAEERATLLDVARRTAERLFIPLTIGGGVRTADDVARALRAGADKVSLNSAAVSQPRGAHRGRRPLRRAVCGGQHRCQANAEGVYKVWVKGGREETPLEAVAWAQECVARGAGEILLTSIDRDGARTGYDLAITRAVADAVNVPVIASGGAGTAQHLVDAVVRWRTPTPCSWRAFCTTGSPRCTLKQVMRDAGLPVRALRASRGSSSSPEHASHEHHCSGSKPMWRTSPPSPAWPCVVSGAACRSRRRATARPSPSPTARPKKQRARGSAAHFPQDGVQARSFRPCVRTRSGVDHRPHRRHQGVRARRTALGHARGGVRR